MNHKTRKNLYIGIAIATIIAGLFKVFTSEDKLFGVAVITIGISLIAAAYEEYRKMK